MYNKALVPTDGSINALLAINFAADLLKIGICKSVTLIHVVNISEEFSHFSIINTKRVDEEFIKSKLQNQGKQILAVSSEIFKQRDLSVDTIVELNDDPGDRIIKLSKEQKFDLIIMGKRGISVMKEIILGSVSSKVLHNAECPVIVYKG